MPSRSHPHHSAPQHLGDYRSPVPASARIPGSERKRRRFNRGLVLKIAVGLTLAGAGFAAASRFGWTGLRTELLELNPVATIAGMAILPLFGFSVAAVYVIAGAKFGLPIGGLIIFGITAFHLAASHFIARRILRRPFERLFGHYRAQLPHLEPGEERSVAAIAVLAPAIPYFARNYLLALSGIRLRTYLPICAPLYTLRSYVTLSLGDLTSGWSNEKAFWLVVIYAAKLGVCALLLLHLRQRLRARRAGPEDEAYAAK